MKKTLVALAAFSAVSAFAQTTVTLTGRMDGAYKQIKNFGQSVGLIEQNGASTTAIKFTATEDLGAGLKAGFMYEIDPLLVSGNGNTTIVKYPSTTAQLNTTSNVNQTVATNIPTQPAGLTGNGEQYVMISDAALGTIKMGTPNTATLDAFGAGSPFGTAVGSGYGSTGLIFGDLTRFESTAKYESPLMNGFQISYLIGPKNDTAYGTSSTSTSQTIYNKRNNVTELGLHYIQGPLTLRGVILSSAVGPNGSTTSTSTNVTTKTTTIGGLYDLGYMKVHGTLQNVIADNSVMTANTDTKATSFGITYPMGANRILAKYSQLKNDQGAYVVQATKSKVIGLGLERDLSKNTYAYIRYEKAQFNHVLASSYIVNGVVGGATQLADPNRTTTAIGVSMGF
jgi:predicted porin